MKISQPVGLQEGFLDIFFEYFDNNMLFLQPYRLRYLNCTDPGRCHWAVALYAFQAVEQEPADTLCVSVQRELLILYRQFASIMVNLTSIS